MNRKQVTLEQIESIRCNAEESETTINMQRNDKFAEIWTSDNMMLTKLKRCMQENPEMYECYEGSRDCNGFMTGYFFLVKDKKLITLRKKSKKKLQLTDEQKAVRAERLRKSRIKKGENK